MPARYGDDFFWSLTIGASAATVSLAVAIPWAWWSRFHGWCAAAALLCGAVLVAMPGPLVGELITRAMNVRQISWLVWLYDRTAVPPVAAATTRCFPLTLLLAWIALRSVSQDQLDAATLLGLRRSGQLLLVALPQRLRPLAAAWLAAFAIASSDLSATIRVIPPGIETVPRRVFGLIHAGVDDQAAAICLFNLIGILAVAGVICWLLAPRRRPLSAQHESMQQK